MAVRIFLIRHGETDWNRDRRFQGRTDVLLNQEGRKQARALAFALKEETLAAIYSSPLLRAMETARIIKAFHPGASLLEEKGLIEMDLGSFDGIEAHRWAELYPDFRKAWREAPSCVTMPGGESLQEVQVRALDALDRITQLYPHETTLLVCSHNFVNLTLLCHALKMSLDDLRKLKQEPAALNVLYKEGDRLWAEVLNERSHLQKHMENGGE